MNTSARQELTEAMFGEHVPEVYWGFSLAEVHRQITEEERFRSYTAAHHQGAIEKMESSQVVRLS